MMKRISFWGVSPCRSSKNAHWSNPFLFSFIFFNFFKILFISLLAVLGSLLLHGLFSSCSAWASCCSGFFCCWAGSLRHVDFSSCSVKASLVVVSGLESRGSIVVSHGLSCSMACGIFPTQESNPSLLCLLHRQADPLPLSHQGSPLTSPLSFLMFPALYLWSCHSWPIYGYWWVGFLDHFPMLIVEGQWMELMFISTWWWPQFL